MFFQSTLSTPSKTNDMSKKDIPSALNADGEFEEPYPWRQWIFGDAHADTHHFAETVMQRAPKEVFCAGAASLLVSPIVSIIDKCIVTAGSGKGEFMKAIMAASKEMVVKPKSFFGGLSFVLTATVYFGTYATANLSELALDMKKIRDDEQRKTMKVGASAVANIGLLAWRDSVFAREFTANAQLSVPLPCVLLDCLQLVMLLPCTLPFMLPRALLSICKKNMELSSTLLN